MSDPGTTAGWPEGVARFVLATSPSTNAEALRRAPETSGAAWFLTHRQTSGRGRRGREWVMPEGNFAATLLTRPKGGIAEAAQLSFVAALALYDALASACGPSVDLAIKWPNDVLLNGGKVAGILLESAGDGRDQPAVAVGIGVNLAAAPGQGEIEVGGHPAVSVLGESGKQPTPEALLDHLAPAFARWQHQLETYGFAPIRQAWLARAARLGTEIIARTTSAESRGIFEGIDESGALILATADGRRAIPAADVFFRGEA